MVFVSDTFIFLFLPLFLICYAISPSSLRNVTILAFSVIFYGWWRFDFVPLLIGIACWSWVTGLWIASASDAQRFRRLIGGIAVPLAALVYFKYANLLIGSAASLGVPVERLSDVPLPIGLSFFVFGAISYSVDVYRKTVFSERSLINYSTYQAMFGHLVAGPIVRYEWVAERIKSRVFDSAEFTEGLRRFMLGFAQKVLIADTLAPLVDAGYALPAPSSMDVIITVLAYTLQLFFDFSGYSSMAIGLGLLVGLKFPENFANPYLSTSLAEFWRRWHISLSSWLRDYLYIPLGGNRAGASRVATNLLITMGLGGLWHGASWTFLLWGLWHGAGLLIQRIWRSRAGINIGPILGHLLTIAFVMVGWALFRAQDWESARIIFGGLLGLNGYAASSALSVVVRPVVTIALILGITVVYAPVIVAASSRMSSIVARPPFGMALILWIFSLWVLQGRIVVPFLYFQF